MILIAQYKNKYKVSDEKERAIKVGQLVKDTINFVPGQVEPIYQIMEFRDGKYLMGKIM